MVGVTGSIPVPRTIFPLYFNILLEGKCLLRRTIWPTWRKLGGEIFQHSSLNVFFGQISPPSLRNILLEIDVISRLREAALGCLIKVRSSGAVLLT
jgi:hypothetical protein